MSKHTRKAGGEQLLFRVGTQLEEHTTRAPDARGAVRQFCAALPDEYWYHRHDLRVWTRVEGSDQPIYWSVDASHPPAWLIERAAAPDEED